ncbi:NfeD family protein [Carboxylicivirga sp. RSCT41]|uniref:NfeD family protein n=1 Tax=Carboxylicivirga agarovorans TaxID=3417570 RepID=UPI003D3362C9
MSALVIILIILLGLFLFILEFFVFPGVTIAGIGGFIFTAGGILLTYQGYGTTYGNIALFSTLLAGLMMLVMSFRSKTWNRLMLKTEVEGKVETVEESNLNVGDEGVAVTRLNPVGKVMVNGELIEGKCPGHFVDENTEVVVKEVFKTYIIVKPKN